ncbi:tryptophan--tRNA ligase, chloroplastic/mitochondrial isoform X1 [Amborella trichopoda]|uniref:tryptophan--tRNA ligase, chloroplastic/mitochondrial isoform X1 n=1 Tax=Amborella trichopoda TaxID=13333 RepID=UPI0009BE8549|nr:tryptophan--tRNA ligase, chloroplastic/mitochondrial isoform X1 [Amborella trichopoda]|eukprot:XP_020528701.1 tryptophan--tRNA ligase, chloroplastic/mitochondrial isoform X1 [Amborella trichopoda]
MGHSILISTLACCRIGTNYLRRSRGRWRKYGIDATYLTKQRNAPLSRCYASLSESGDGEIPISVKKRVVSGVQPTGAIHLGNYLGAIKNWVWLQDTYETLFFIVDLHAITLSYDAQQLSTTTRNTAAIYIACGIDPSKASIFVQSHVHAHVELMWLLSSITPLGWLNRMIQFKEKSRKAGDENVGAALLTYPVLMASDILLYQCDLVPVGEDQKQHLELTRELAERVNYLFGGKKWKKMGGRGGRIFKMPEALIPPAGARVMSLTDGLSKMSKSAPSDQSRINLLDTRDMIANKIKRCKTDSFSGLEFDNPERPECNNLLSVYQLVTGRSKEEVALECQNMTWGTFKTKLTDALIDHLQPIQLIWITSLLKERQKLPALQMLPSIMFIRPWDFCDHERERESKRRCQHIRCFY